VNKVVGNGEFQDGRQNGRRTLSASLARLIIAQREQTWCLFYGFRGQGFHSDHSLCQKSNGSFLFQ